MRRDELASADQFLFDEVCSDVMAGYLGVITESGTPRSIAVNFVAIGQDIYFHGALAGEKFELLRHDPLVGFTVVKEYSYLPSHWSAPDFACPATQAFKSVEIKGTCSLVQAPAEKAQALQAMMEKYQPEGEFVAIDPAHRHYSKALDRVGVFRVQCQSWTGKNKFAQGKPEKLLRVIVENLRARGGATDEATAIEIERFLAG